MKNETYQKHRFSYGKSTKTVNLKQEKTRLIIIKGLKGIAKYGADGKKIFEIHTTDYHGLGAHFHPWKDGHPLDAKPLTDSMKKLIDNVLNFK